MKITVYTIKDCVFSKQEKDYLNANKLTFEEKDLETNKDFLTEMLAISNNFAGTPVTRVEKDDGTIAVLKGFTKEEFDTTFGLAPAPVVDASAPPAPPQVNDTPITPPTDTPPVVEPSKAEPAVPAMPQAPVEAPTEVPPAPDLSGAKDAAAVADSLQSVMDTLQSKSQDAASPAPTPPPVVEPVAPATPPVVDPSAPAIPDFPAK
jgi:glutaredoxin